MIYIFSALCIQYYFNWLQYTEEKWLISVWFSETILVVTITLKRTAMQFAEEQNWQLANALNWHVIHFNYTGSWYSNRQLFSGSFKTKHIPGWVSVLFLQKCSYLHRLFQLYFKYLGRIYDWEDLSFLPKCETKFLWNFAKHYCSRNIFIQWQYILSKYPLEIFLLIVFSDCF